MKSKLIAK